METKSVVDELKSMMYKLEGADKNTVSVAISHIKEQEAKIQALQNIIREKVVEKTKVITQQYVRNGNYYKVYVDGEFYCNCDADELTETKREIMEEN